MLDASPLNKAKSRNRDSGGGNNARNAVTSSSAKTNPFPDSRLTARFQGSSFTSIKAMMEGHEVTIPKHGSDEVCLSWALKGRCNSHCDRKQQHLRYSRDTLREIHTLLDDCGVSSAQE